MRMVLFGASVLIFLSACSKPKDSLKATSFTNTATSTVEQQKALSVLLRNCASCHSNGVSNGGVGYLNDLDQVAKNLVVPGAPASSKLYSVITDGTMPPAGPLAAEDVKAIEDWINSILPPTTTEVDTGPPGTFTQVNAIIVAKCVSCHNASHQIPLTTYAEIDAAVYPGNASASLLYDAVVTARMPKSGTPLTTAELTTIRTWINAGAANN